MDLGTLWRFELCDARGRIQSYGRFMSRQYVSRRNKGPAARQQQSSKRLLPGGLVLDLDRRNSRHITKLTFNYNTSKFSHMKIKILIFGAFLASFAGVSAQTVSLPAPQIESGPAVLGILAQRQSSNAFDSRPLAAQDLANLLWGAMGQNRENGKLTAPSASNKQEVRLFVFTDSGVSEYLPHSHELKKVADGDHRALVAGHQEFVKSAPVSLVLVADMDKFGGTEPRQLTMATVDVGIVCQNISVTAAGLGLASRPRGSMNGDAIQKLLGLNANQIPIMNNVIGYPAKK